MYNTSMQRHPLIIFSFIIKCFSVFYMSKNFIRKKPLTSPSESKFELFRKQNIACWRLYPMPIISWKEILCFCSKSFQSQLLWTLTNSHGMKSLFQYRSSCASLGCWLTNTFAQEPEFPMWFFIYKFDCLKNWSCFNRVSYFV